MKPKSMRVRWEIDVEAKTALEAAQAARAAQLRPGTIATVFEVGKRMVDVANRKVTPVHRRGQPRRYTVLLMRPDYMTDDYGSDTYLGWVEAKSPTGAIKQAQAEAVAHDDGEQDRASDYAPVVTLEGWHRDLTPS